MKLSKLQEEFINLLETTDQPQGRGMLCNAKGFCCLGLWAQHRGAKITYKREPGYKRGYFNGSTYYLPKQMAYELGLYDELGCSRNAQLDALASLNDDGRSFKEIASIIRKDPSMYFDEH